MPLTGIIVAFPLLFLFCARAPHPNWSIGPAFISGSKKEKEKKPSQKRCHRSLAGPLITARQGPRYKPRNFQGADKARWIIARAPRRHHLHEWLYWRLNVGDSFYLSWTGSRICRRNRMIDAPARFLLSSPRRPGSGSRARARAHACTIGVYDEALVKKLSGSKGVTVRADCALLLL